MVKARFHITGINVPPPGEENEVRDSGNNFLKMLIEEGIPVNYLSEEKPMEESSNVGVILSPTNPIAEEALNTVPQNLTSDDSDLVSNAVDSIVEVTSSTKPISKPLFLTLIPSQSSIHDVILEPDDIQCRRQSADPSTILLPTESTTLPVKKKVRFDLPGRKASLIGEYEILKKPVSNFNCNISKHKQKSRLFAKNLHSSNEFSSAAEDEGWPGKSRNKTKQKVRIMTSLNFEGQESHSDDSDNDLKADNAKRLFLHDYESDEENFERKIENEEKDFEKGDFQCGLRSWTPKWLQKFARSECYLIVFCIVAIAQGMLYTYNISVVSTVQKRFNFSSKQTGFILSGNDISQIVTSIFVAFYGTYGHRPKWLGTASIISAIAALVAASPHAIYGGGEYADKVQENPNGTKVPPSWKPKIRKKLELCGFQLPEDCSSNSTSIPYEEALKLPPMLIFFSQLLVGFSNSVFWTVGISYLDDNLSKRKTSLHIAVFSIARVIGPTFGFMLGGYCLSMWIDPTNDVDLSTYDPRWLGAWWLGFVILSLAIVLPGLLYFCFPRHLPKENKKTYYIQSPLCLIHGENGEIYRHTPTSFYGFSNMPVLSNISLLQELPKALKRLFTNKIWTANVFSNVFFVLAMSGYWTFKPKYIQTQFRKSASTANFYTGITTMIASVVGIGVSGIIMRWVRPRTSHVTVYNVFLSMYAIIALFALMTIHCPSSELAGHLPGQDKWACSEHCSCSETFSPICAEDGVTTFYSPCFAGCTAINFNVNPVEYVNCTCFGRVRWKKEEVEEESYFVEETPSFSINEGWALDGYCHDSCNALTIYLIIQLINKVIFATGRIGGTLVNLRSVEEKDKTLALGCLAVFVSFAGFLPSSYVMGIAIDSTCLVWDTRCGKRGSCSFYDNDKFRLVMHVIPAVLLVLSGMGDIIVHVNNSSLRIYGEENNIDSIEESTETLKVKRKARR